MRSLGAQVLYAMVFSMILPTIAPAQLPPSSFGNSSPLAPIDRLNQQANQTMNFVNVTGTRIIESVNEQTDNEKEVEVGDVDNDGDLDVVLVAARSFFTSGARRNKLYINEDGVFTEVTAAKVPGFMNVDISRNVFLRDYDDDGWLDLIVVNDFIGGPTYGTTRFYANKHPNGVFSHFEDETSRLNGAHGDACGGFSLDFNLDGKVDLYLGNYPGGSQDTMYFNDGTGSFTNVTATNVPLDSDYTVDVCAGDINGDGKPDIMVCNENDSNFIYYNNNNGGGTGPGDFRYTNSTQSFTATNGIYPAMEPGDFNGDSNMDIYFANKGPNGATDKLLMNQGNDDNGKATFTEFTMPTMVSGSPTAKVVVSDLNRDKRVDLIVMGGDTFSQFSAARRTVIYRNTSVNGQVSFVEWSPANVFPSGPTQAGWHAAVFDSNKDGRQDIFVGGMNDDHLYLAAQTPKLKDTTVVANGLPNIHNGSPLAILGNLKPNAVDELTGSLPAGAKVSVVLQSKAGLRLEILNSGGNVVALSDRGGAGVEEALQFSAPGGTLTFRVINDQPHNLRIDGYVLEILSRSND